MFRTYAEVAVLAAKRAARSWLAALSIPLYALVIVGSAAMLAPLGLLGGFIVGFIAAACCAGYLSVLASSVEGSQIRLADLKTGMRAVWDVCSVMFALWIISMLVMLLKGMAGSNGTAVVGVVGLAIAIFFNVIPELIYNSRNRSFALLKESAGFVMENPFAWFAPNLLFAVALLAATGSLSAAAPGEMVLRLAALVSPGGALALVTQAPLWMAPLLVAFFHYVMVFRGLLYRELASGSTRMRAFRRSMSA